MHWPDESPRLSDTSTQCQIFSALAISDQTGARRNYGQLEIVKCLECRKESGRRQPLLRGLPQFHRKSDSASQRVEKLTCGWDPRVKRLSAGFSWLSSGRRTCVVVGRANIQRVIHPQSISTLGQKGRLSKCALKGSKHALIFFRVALPHHYLHTGSSTRKIVKNIPLFPKVARFAESQVDEAPECGRSKSNAHLRG